MPSRLIRSRLLTVLSAAVVAVPIADVVSILTTGRTPAAGASAAGPRSSASPTPTPSAPRPSHRAVVRPSAPGGATGAASTPAGSGARQQTLTIPGASLLSGSLDGLLRPGPLLPELPDPRALTGGTSGPVSTVPGSFPSAATTGVPAGTTLTPYTGDTVISTPGTVIDHAMIVGCLVVQVTVTIRDSKIVCNQGRAALLFMPPDSPDPVMSTVSDVEIDGQGAATVGLTAKYVVATGLDVHGTGDGVHLGSDATLQDSYVHDLGSQPGLHHDCLQTLQGSTASGIRVLHDTLINDQVGGNTVYHFGSGAISDVLVADNYLDGGHYSFQVDNGPQQDDIVIRDNVIGRHYDFGLLDAGNGSAVTFTGNVYTDGTAATVANSLGAGLGELT